MNKGLGMEVWDMAISWALGKGRKYSSFVTFFFALLNVGTLG